MVSGLLTSGGYHPHHGNPYKLGENTEAKDIRAVTETFRLRHRHPSGTAK